MERGRGGERFVKSKTMYEVWKKVSRRKERRGKERYGEGFLKSQDNARLCSDNLPSDLLSHGLEELMHLLWCGVQVDDSLAGPLAVLAGPGGDRAQALL